MMAINAEEVLEGRLHLALHKIVPAEVRLGVVESSWKSRRASVNRHTMPGSVAESMTGTRLCGATGVRRARSATSLSPGDVLGHRRVARGRPPAKEEHRE